MYLVDTNVLSDSTKVSPNASILSWMEVNESSVRISVISLGEIHYGIELLADGRKKNRLRNWLAQLRTGYAESVIPLDEAVALRWGALKADLDCRGRKLPAVDSLLVATALEHDLTLVTTNPKDFRGSGVKLFNPALGEEET